MYEEDTDEVDLLALMDSRARMYGMLARLYRVEVDKKTLEELQAMKFPVSTGNATVDEGYRQMYDYLKRAWDDSVTELAIDYVRVFIGHGINGYSAAYPFESVYTSERRLLMQEARAEMLEVLHENHLKKGTWNDAEDHIAIQLELMQRLTQRAAEALGANDDDLAEEYVRKMREFLDEHLLNWVPAMAEDICKFAKTLFYQGLAHLTLGYLEEDEAILGELLGEVA